MPFLTNTLMETKMNISTAITKYDYFIVEPLLIYSDVGKWTHPDIAELVEKHCDGHPVYTGPLVKFHLDKENAGSITVVALLPVEGDAEKAEKCYWKDNGTYDEDVAIALCDELVAALEITLDDDVWCPGGGAQWCETRYGRRFQRLVGLTSDYFTSFSPDVGVHLDPEDGTSWTYSS